ncbi:MAG: hypothetical protein ACREPI_02765 [Candidatus Dormibacterales bacterium]
MTYLELEQMVAQRAETTARRAEASARLGSGSGTRKGRLAGPLASALRAAADRLEPPPDPGVAARGGLRLV